MKNFAIVQIVPNTRQCLEPALPSPGAAGGWEAPAGCTSCSANCIPGGCPRLHLKDVVPWQGHVARCPFPTAIVELPPRSGGASRERCSVVSQAVQHLTSGGALPHERWSLSRVMKPCLTSGGAPHQGRSVL